MASTIPGSPAAAGLQQGDVIVAYDKAPIEDYRQLQRLVADTPVGKTVTLRSGAPARGGRGVGQRGGSTRWHSAPHAFT